MSTGLMIPEKDVKDLVSLMGDFRWQALERLVSGIKDLASQRIKSRKNTLQDYGYWSGVIQTCEDIQTMPLDLAKQIKGEAEKNE